MFSMCFRRIVFNDLFTIQFFSEEQEKEVLKIEI